MPLAWVEILAITQWWDQAVFKLSPVTSIIIRERSLEKWSLVWSNNPRPNPSTTSLRCKRKTYKIIIEIWKSPIISLKMRTLDSRLSCNRFKKSWITETRSWSTSLRGFNSPLPLPATVGVAKLPTITPTRALWSHN